MKKKAKAENELSNILKKNYHEEKATITTIQ